MQETASVITVSVRELHLGRRLQLGRWGVWVECGMPILHSNVIVRFCLFC